TWWDSNPIMIHGINYLPFQGGSLYLGRHPALVKREYDAIMERTRGKVFTWRDYVLMYQALTDGKKASATLDEDTYLEPEFGNSHALTYTWIRALAELGRVDATVTADVPTYAVLQRKGKRAYVAYNPSDAAKVVTFSDGFSVKVPAKGLVEKTADAPDGEK